MPAPSLNQASRSVRVYLPSSYDRPEARARRYPVVFLLHGWPGGEGNWPGEGGATKTLDSLMASGAIPEMIAVMPSGTGIGLLGRSLYVNSYDGRSRMEDYVVRDLVTWVDSTFRTRREARARALVGLSEGGGAAVNLAFKHPDVFGGCGSHSGEFELDKGLGEGKIVGPEPEAMRLRRENSPLEYVDRVAPRIQGMAIYFREPSGVLFEIADDGPGFARDGSLADLGRKLILPPWFEAQRAEIEARLTPIPDPRASWPVRA